MQKCMEYNFAYSEESLHIDVRSLRFAASVSTCASVSQLTECALIVPALLQGAEVLGCDDIHSLEC